MFIDRLDALLLGNRHVEISAEHGTRSWRSYYMRNGWRKKKGRSRRQEQERIAKLRSDPVWIVDWELQVQAAPTA